MGKSVGESVSLSLSKAGEERMAAMVLLDAGQVRLSDLPSRLGLTPRQLRRVRARWKSSGASGLADLRRGNGGNRSRACDRERFVSWYRGLSARGRYPPSHAAERFAAECGVSISSETARRWLTGAGLWSASPRRAPASHPPRPRRPRRGELVQIDASEHEWVEGYRWVLQVFIDDATSEVLHARFARTESSLSYLGAMEECFGRHGVPVAVYTDRHTAFVPHARDGARGESQLGRVFRSSRVEHIVSLSPQSRGRVERAHLTAQQRLLRELANALSGMSFADEDAALSAANDYLDGWVGRHNQRFAVAPADASDAHVPLALDAPGRRQLFSVQVGRRLSADRVFSHEGSRHVVESLPAGVGLGDACRAGVTVHVRPDGERFVSVLGVEVPTREVSRGRAGAEAVDSRELNRAVDRAVSRRRPGRAPGADHPCRRGLPA